MLQNCISLYLAGKLVKRKLSVYNQEPVRSCQVFLTVSQIPLKRDETCKLTNLEDVRVTILRGESLNRRVLGWCRRRWYNI